MFRSLRSLLRTGRRALFPISRTVLLLLAWTNRHTVSLWYRSLRTEISDHGFDSARVRQLIRALWTISRDRRTTNAQPLQLITVRDDGFGIEASDGWIGRATVETLLAPIAPTPTVVSKVA